MDVEELEEVKRWVMQYGGEIVETKIFRKNEKNKIQKM